MREFLLLLAAIIAAGSSLPAQDEVPPAPKGGIQIAFLPPPMQGTLSLGIFNKAGKLVRTLKREAVADKDFVVGLNGLITQWDGKNDAGQPAAPGTYAVRGFCVGLVEVSGESFYCNDWISSDDSPHLAAIDGITAAPGERVTISGTLADSSPVLMICGLDGQPQPAKSERVVREVTLEGKAKLLATMTKSAVQVRGGKFVVPSHAASLPDLHQVLDAAPGKGGSVWLIDHSEKRVEVQQYSAGGEFLRRLTIDAADPVPEQIAASDTSDLIFLLERADGLQRVRALALESLKAPLPVADGEVPPGAPKSSTWRIAFSKTIRRCDDFARVADQLGRPTRPKPETKVSVKLLPNPLSQEAAPTAEVVIAMEPGGSFLQTADGLLLRRLTDTPALKWAVLVKEPKNHTLFQSDGAVVEEYRLGKLTNMMAFDAGEYDLK